MNKAAVWEHRRHLAPCRMYDLSLENVSQCVSSGSDTEEPEERGVLNHRGGRKPRDLDPVPKRLETNIGRCTCNV